MQLADLDRYCGKTKIDIPSALFDELDEYFTKVGLPTRHTVSDKFDDCGRKIGTDYQMMRNA